MRFILTNIDVLEQNWGTPHEALRCEYIDITKYKVLDTDKVDLKVFNKFINGFRSLIGFEIFKGYPVMNNSDVNVLCNLGRTIVYQDMLTGEKYSPCKLTLIVDLDHDFNKEIKRSFRDKRLNELL